MSLELWFVIYVEGKLFRTILLQSSKIKCTFAPLNEQRGVAQSGSAPGLGPGGRRFESCHPDNMQSVDNENYQHFIFYYTSTI